MTDISSASSGDVSDVAPVPPAPQKPREIEIKFAADEAGFAAALASPLLRPEGDKTPAKRLISIYYDTPDWDLQRRKVALRVRRSGRSAPVMTLKWQAEEGEGLFARGEIEFPLRAMTPDVNLFDGETGEGLRLLIGDKPLQAKYETRVNRTARLVRAGAALVEAAFDEGEIVAGELTRAIREVELELKEGPEADLLELGRRLAAELPLRLDMASKAERAFHLARTSTPAPVKTRVAALGPEFNLDAAMARIILATSDHFLVNWTSLRASDAPESIHQMRVALRRLRAALAMFKRAIPSAEFDAFRARARDLANALGPARDCDALRDLVEDGPMPHFAKNGDFAPLLEALDTTRKQAYAQARALIESAEPTLFALDLGALSRGVAGAIRCQRKICRGSPIRSMSSPAPRSTGSMSACSSAVGGWPRFQTNSATRRESP